MIRNYFKIALRNIKSNPFFTFLNVFGLSIGLTASFLIFSYVKFELSYDGFHAEKENIYRIVSDTKTPSEVTKDKGPAWAVPYHMAKEFPEIKAITRVYNFETIFNKNGNVYGETNTIYADPDFFKVFDFKLVDGDIDNLLKVPFSVVLSQSAAKKYFGDEDPLGKTLKILDEQFPVKVTGVMEDMPSNSSIKADLVLSLTTFTERLSKGQDLNNKWGWYEPEAYVLLNPQTNRASFTSKLPAFLEKYDGKHMRENEKFVSLSLEPLSDVYFSDRNDAGGGHLTTVYIFSIIAFFIILIASINFINLTTARSVERAKEVGVRKVIGALKNQLSLQFLGESLIICFIAFLITIVFTYLVHAHFNTLAGKTIIEDVLAPKNILMLFTITMSVGLVAGIYPAFVLSSFKSVSVLKGNFSTGFKGVLLRKVLVITQFTVSIVLIIGTIVIYNQMQFMKNQELGFNKEQTLVLKTRVNKKQRKLKNTINQVPGVTSICSGSSVPGGDNPNASSKIQNANGDMQNLTIDLYFTDYDYANQFGLKTVAGRTFSKDFPSDANNAMVINEKAAKFLGYKSPQDAIGNKYSQWGSNGTIIGVIKDFHFNSLHKNIKPLTMRMSKGRTHLMIVKLNSQNIKSAMATIEKQWNAILPERPFEYYFLDEFFDRQYKNNEKFNTLFLSFAILAIIISCLGLLGLAAYSTLLRKKEIGIRKVLGASVTTVVSFLSIDFIKLVGIAFLIATPISWLLMNTWLQNFAYKIDVEWWVFAFSGSLTLFIALVTVSFHAIKTAVVKPIKSLRTE